MFGYWLRRRRKALDLTQAELAAQAGCVVTTIKKIETGARRPSAQLAARLAAALALSGEERAMLLAAAAGPAELPPLPGPAAASALQLLPLPAAAGPLIGRAGELADLQALLTQGATRLVTLTGPGGVGKTRLALEAAADLRGAFADGTAFIDLAPINDPTLAPAAIARSLGYEAGAAPLAVLTRALADLHALLVLDNFEQVAPAAPVVAQLLAAAPHLKILVTSRAPLRIQQEQEYAVAPLETPPEDLPENLPEILPEILPELAPKQQARGVDTYAAVQLFVRRAGAVQPHFTLTEENGAAIATICRRLDGLPLAIELAAVHVRLFTPAALLRKLDRRLVLLAGGARDLPARQQTLRATLDWSYRLLHAREQRIFARCGVFVGSAGLEAVEVVCGAGERGEVFTALTALLEQSLLYRSGDGLDEPRIGMLETIREYALELLRASGEEAIIRARHAAYYLGLAEAAAPKLRGPEQLQWLDCLEADHDNLRAAGDWLHHAGRIEEELRLTAALHWFWDRRGYLDEGRTRIRRALQAAPNASRQEKDKHGALLRARAWTLIGAAALAFDQGDYAAVAAAAEEGLPLCEQLADRGGLALALLRLAFVASAVEPARARDQLAAARTHAAAAGDPWFIGLALFVSAQAALFGRGDAAAARLYIAEALPALETSGDLYLLGHGLGTLGLVELAGGDLPAARAALERGLALVRELRDTRSTAILAATTADVARCQGDYTRAAELYSESLALYQEIGNHAEIPAILHNQGYVALGARHYAAARELFAESLRRQLAAGNTAGIAEGIHGLAALAAGQGQLERAARLFGAAAALAAAHPAPVWPAERYEIERYSALVDAGLPGALVNRLRQEGRVYSLENAIAYALADGGPVATQKQRSRGDSLSEREREVAALIGQGASNRVIADALVISERTVERHVANIFAKLNFGSRTQIAAFAVESGIMYGRG